MKLDKEYKIGEYILKSVNGKVIIRSTTGVVTPNELYNSELTKRLFCEMAEKIEQLESKIANLENIDDGIF